MSNEQGIYLRRSSETDIEELKNAFERSKLLHSKFVDEPGSYEEFIGQEHRYLVCLQSTDEIVGFYNISEIVKGCFQSAYLGFAAFEPNQRKGFMSKGIQLLLRIAFDEINLHRLEANIQPDNIASKNLVKKANFVKEGYSVGYLKISNKWRDHERWAIINEDWVDK